MRFPLRSGIDAHVWAGKPADSDLDSLLDSPLRREIAKRLLGGQSAVWVLLDSSDKGANDTAEALLKAELPRLEKDLKLPEVAQQDEALLAGGPELKIAFSMLRLSREDPAEQVLVRTLLATEPDLKGIDEPMAFPVFGRGRAHWALVGPGISQENIADLAAFLVGECSCEVKEQNPGADLLMTAAWDQLSGAFVVDETLPPLVGLPPVAAVAAKTPTVAPAATAAAQPDPKPATNTLAAVVSTPKPADPPSRRPLATGIIVACAAILAVVTLGTVWLRSKQTST
jgi:hypothetical protein